MFRSPEADRDDSSPVFTIKKHPVPKVLLNGNHEEIRRWRRKMSLGMTLTKRPDLLKNVKLTKEDDKLLKEYVNEQKNK